MLASLVRKVGIRNISVGLSFASCEALKFCYCCPAIGESLNQMFCWANLLGHLFFVDCQMSGVGLSVKLSEGSVLVNLLLWQAPGSYFCIKIGENG
jgi:hypothetical protein